jgi:sortase (surface protein transpeptidase)
MTSRRSAAARTMLPAFLAVVLSGQSLAAVPAPADMPTAERSSLPAARTADALPIAAPSSGSAREDRHDERATSRLRPVVESAARPSDDPGGAPAGAKPATRVAPTVPAATAKSVRTVASGSRSSGPSSYSGRDRVWIPSLGIERSVTPFACTSNAYPGDRVYRWGCAGRNNVYLFGHAHSVYKPLHDAYVRGRLQKGMKLIYADSAGTIRTYEVAWWRVVTPDKGEFAYAPQSRPSVTLQTCVGTRSQYRLIVRLFLSV